MNRQCDWFTNLHLITLPGQVRTCKAFKVWITSVTELTGFTNMHSITLPGQVHTNLQSMNRKCDWIYKYEFHHTIWPSQFLQSLQLWIVSVTEFIYKCAIGHTSWPRKHPLVTKEKASFIITCKWQIKWRPINWKRIHYYFSKTKKGHFPAASFLC